MSLTPAFCLQTYKIWKLCHVIILGRHINAIKINWHFTEKSVVGQWKLVHIKCTIWIYMTMANLHWLSIDLLWNWNKLTLTKAQAKAHAVFTEEHYLVRFPQNVLQVGKWVSRLWQNLYGSLMFAYGWSSMVLRFHIWSTPHIHAPPPWSLFSLKWHASQTA